MTDTDSPELKALLADAHARSRTPEGRRPLTVGALGEILIHIARDTKGFVRGMLAPHTDRFDAIEARVRALETRGPGVKWAGTHEPGVRYAEGALATRQGGLWIALHDTEATPGASEGHWRLIVKAGAYREGR